MKAVVYKPDGPAYEFGPFRLLPEERQLLRNGELVALPPKAFDTLVVLVLRSGHAIKKDDLIGAVWPDAVVEDNNLNQYISLLRKTLGNADEGGQYIETVARYGYRFTSEVRETNDSALLIHKRSRTQVVVREETYERQDHARVELATRSTANSQWKLVLGLVIVATTMVGIAAAALLSKESGRFKEAPTTVVIH